METQFLYRRVASAQAILGTTALISLIALAAPNARAQLYGITHLSNELIRISPTDGSATLVGSTTGSSSAIALASFGGKLYTFDGSANVIRQINPLTGAVLTSVGIGVSGSPVEGDIAFNPLTGTGFLSTVGKTSSLYSFNLAAGTSSLIGTTSAALEGLAFNSTGTILYGLSVENNGLYSVNVANAATTLIGSGFGVDSFGVNVAGSPNAGITFGSNGTLYGAINDGLYTINTTSGIATSVDTTNYPEGGSFGSFGSISGIANITSAAAPEPGSILMFATGILGMTGCALVRRRRPSLEA